MNIPTHETSPLPDLTPEQYEILLKETLRSLGDLGAYFIRVDENDGAIIIRQWSVIQSACGGTVPETLAPDQRPSQKRLERVTHLLAHVNRALQIGKPLIVRAEAIASVCHSAVPTDQ